VWSVRQVSSEHLRELAADGVVVPSTPVRRVSTDGVSPWSRAGEVKGLFTGDVSTRLGGPICGDCSRLLSNGRCPHCSPVVAMAAPIPPPPLPAPPPTEHVAPVKKKRPRISISLAAVVFSLVGIIALLQAAAVSAAAESIMHQLYSALWFIVAAVLFVGAGITSEVKHLADRIA